MRALIVDPSSRGGIAAYTAVLQRALFAAGVENQILGSRVLAQANAGDSVLRMLPDDGWGRPPAAGLGFYFGRASTWTRSAAAVARQTSKIEPDVVHFQVPINRRLDAILLRWLGRRRPMIWTAHDVLPFERTEADRARFAAIYRAVDRVIVHSQQAAEELRALAGVDPVVIEHPVPEGFVGVDRREARARLGLKAEGRLFSMLGFIRAYKGFGLIAEVWERLGPSAPRLLVMGQLLAEEEQSNLDRLARTGRVDLRLGYATDADLGLATSAADALLLPYSEASESGLLHLARAAGVPVIASDAPQLAASINASRAGVALPRDVETWAEAVTGQLPPAPPPSSTSIAEVGAEHRAVYQQAVERRH